MTRYVWEQSFWMLKNGKPIVVLIGRDYDNPTIVKTLGFGNQRPFFFAGGSYIPSNPFIVETERGHVDAFGRDVTKCYTALPSDVPKVRDLFPFTCEADIVYDMRYLIDHKIMYGFNEKGEPIDVPMLKPRALFFDIEVDSPVDEMPLPEEAKWPICQIQVLDSYTNVCRVFTLNGDVVDPDQVNFDTEQELIGAFVDFVWETDPDLICGWYSEKFDIPYIIRRARLLKMNVSKLSRWPSTYPDEERWQGRELFDMLKFYKDWSKPKGGLPTYDLKFVSKHEAKFAYEDFGDKIRTLIEERRWKELVQYGKNDVIALQKIDEATGLIEFYEALRRMVGIKITDCYQRAKIIEYFLMHRGIKPLPTKRHDAEHVDYEGALVLQPEFGVHEWVGTTDLKALYPSIILAFDLSPDVDHTIPKVIVELMEAREVMRRLKMEGKASKAMLTSEQSLKYVINAFYGYLAFSGARLHKPEIAAFITGKGREISRDLHKKINEMGYTIVYGDTDSTFVKPVKTPEEGIQIQNELNGHLLQWARSVNVADHLAPTLKLEKIYRTLMFKKKSDKDIAAKKRYAGVLVWKDGKDLTTGTPKVDYTGLEVKRSDTAEVSRTLMKQFFDNVLIANDPDTAVRLIRETYYNILDGKISCQLVAIPKGITKNRSHEEKGSSPWIRGKENGRKLLGIRFRSDKKPKLLYCTGPVDVICIDNDYNDVDLLSRVTVDWSKMAMKTVQMKMESLLESIGLNWDAEINGQTNLEKWF
jgi:DNA polymerase, archaea type